MEELKLASLKDGRTEINLQGTLIGGKEIILMGGPCAVESAAQIEQAARTVKRVGGKVLRGGIFKPRTSPYSFQGLGKEGLDYLVTAAGKYGLLAVTEVVDSESLDLVKDKIDIIQIGARNMQNFQLLKLAGKANKPVVLKRGLSATVKEWLLAAEYILDAGNPHVILCERGIRTFETSTRNTLDLSAVGVAKELSHLPVIVDPSHAAGRTDIIPTLAKAAITAGADGLLIEMHPNPAEAKSDGGQSLNPGEFARLAMELYQVAASVNRTFTSTTNLGESLEYFRSRIDAIDSLMVALLSERMQVVKQIADTKSLDKIRDSHREKEIINRLSKVAEDLTFPPDLLQQIYSLIFDFAVEYQISSKTLGDGLSTAHTF